MDYPNKGKSCREVAHIATQFCFRKISCLERSADCHAFGTDVKGSMFRSDMQSVWRKEIAHLQNCIRMLVPATANLQQVQVDRRVSLASVSQSLSPWWPRQLKFV